MPTPNFHSRANSKDAYLDLFGSGNANGKPVALLAEYADADKAIMLVRGAQAKKINISTACSPVARTSGN